MNSLFVIFQVLLLCYEIKPLLSQTGPENKYDNNIDLECVKLQEKFFGPTVSTLSKPGNLDKVEFYLAARGLKSGMKLSTKSLSVINTEYFNPSVKTYIIIHGYRSNYQMPWITELKDKLLKNRKINILLVDWSSASYNWNYINSVRDTIAVAKQLFNFLETLQATIQPRDDTENVLWNNLYFIGHSLGSHISGQTAHLIRDNKFFNVERITGLDPAHPCFEKEHLDVRLNKNHAKFVDVIHTQAGGFGIKEPIGHVDFYVNGGVLQPNCTKSMFTTNLQKKICSHTSSCTDFIASIDIPNSDDCKFWGYKWDGTYDNAVKVFDQLKVEKPCLGCPEMGINAVNDQPIGIFLVFSTTNKPQCNWKRQNIKKVLTSLQEIKQKNSSIRNYYKKYKVK